MKTLQDADDRAALLRRLDRLTPGHRARWGRMTAAQMVAHLVDATRMALGELPARSRLVPAPWRPLVRFLFVNVIPFPRNVRGPREIMGRAPGAWDDERARCAELLERFDAATAPRAWPDHPFLGQLSAREWGVLGWRHTDHHLRQFGV